MPDKACPPTNRAVPLIDKTTIIETYVPDLLKGRIPLVASHRTSIVAHGVGLLTGRCAVLPGLNRLTDESRWFANSNRLPDCATTGNEKGIS